MSEDENSTDAGDGIPPREPSAYSQMMRLYHEWGYPMLEGEALQSRQQRHFAEELLRLSEAFDAEEAEPYMDPDLEAKRIEAIKERRQMTEATVAQMRDRADVQEIREIANAREQLERMDRTRSRCLDLLDGAGTPEALERARDELESFGRTRDFDAYLAELEDAIGQAKGVLAELEPDARERWGEDFEPEVAVVVEELRQKREAELRGDTED